MISEIILWLKIYRRSTHEINSLALRRFSLARNTSCNSHETRAQIYSQLCEDNRESLLQAWLKSALGYRSDPGALENLRLG